MKFAITDDLLMILLLAAAIIVGLVAAWLIIRASRVAAKVSGSAAEEGKRRPAARALLDRLKRCWRLLVRIVHELRARREWRYQVPWILMCGEPGSGRSSLASSISVGRQEQLSLRESRLASAGTRWSFFDSGVLIDLEQECLLTPTHDEHSWMQALRQLGRHRPERPLDGVLLTISARTLLRGSQGDVRRLAERCYAQVVSLQETCEFLLPVYIVVTQCDAIEGFASFWQAQPRQCRQEILGWSNPCGLDVSYVPQWIEAAFEYIDSVLRRLQLQAAAAQGDVANADDLFLLPQRFRALRDNLRVVLDYTFRVAAYRVAPFFRGVYFSGSLGDSATTPLAPRGDVVFVDQLFTEKVFAERNLARPVRQAVWSRHALLRRAQYITLALAAVSFLWLAEAALRLHRQVNVAIGSIALIRHPQVATVSADVCAGEPVVYDLLSKISMVDVDMTFAAIPVSWVDRRPEHGGVRLLANEAFEKVILPAFACELERKARAVTESRLLTHRPEYSLISERKSLREYLDQVLAFERNAAHFRRLAAHMPLEQEEQLLAQMGELARYLYGDPLPDVVYAREGHQRRALAQSAYQRPLRLPDGMREQIARLLLHWSERARTEILEETDAGAPLLEALTQEQPPLLENAQRFDQWLQHLQKQWLTATPASNPCSMLASVLEPKLAELGSRYNYDTEVLNEVVRQFDVSRCYEPAVSHLAQLQVAPQGLLLRRQGDRWELSPALRQEVAGFAAVSNLDLMQVGPARAFSCEQPVRGWRAESLQQAALFIRQYRSFLDAQHLEGSREVLPLYARVARRQLQSVLDDILRGAEQTDTALAAQMVDSMDSLAASEQGLAQQSADLTRNYSSLVWIVSQYQQVGLDSGSRLTECLRRYAADALQRLANLDAAANLYDIPVADGDSAVGLFTVPPQPQVKDYLQTQFRRAQVLASYAGPFVSLLQNTQGKDEGDAPPGAGAAYWDNTRLEINRMVQFKDPAAQAQQLGDFVVKELTPLTADNCHELLDGYVRTSYGDDLFSQRRRALEGRADWQCEDRNKARELAGYQRWARRFNTELAGRFPFAPVETRTEATLQATRNFFVDYSGAREPLLGQLKWLKGEGLAEVAGFLRQLDDTAKLFSGYSPDAALLPPLHLKVRFRVLPAQSSGAQNVISWALTTPAEAASYPNGPTEIDWHYGEDITFTATWAALSSVAPQADRQQQDMSVEGNVVSFRASGAWALLKLIRRHTPSTVIPASSVEPGLVMLELRIPTRDREHAQAEALSRFYVALEVSAADPQTRAPRVVSWPGTFPSHAASVW